MSAVGRPVARHVAAPSSDQPKPKLLDEVRQALRVHHYSRRTEEAYVQRSWQGVFMPIRIRRHDKTLPEPQRTAAERVMASDLAPSMPSYTGSKTTLRILCGYI